MSQLTLQILGKASSRVVASWRFDSQKELPNLSLLEFLRQEKIPIASSCYGEGVCKKCVVNKDQLACQVYLNQLFLKGPRVVIEISYL